MGAGMTGAGETEADMTGAGETGVDVLEAEAMAKEIPEEDDKVMEMLAAVATEEAGIMVVKRVALWAVGMVAVAR